MKSFVFFISFLIFWQNLFGQVSLEGRIINTKGEALSRINILVYLPGTKTLIAFAVSDNEGNFQTTVKSLSDSLYIEVSSVQYRNEYRRITNVPQSLLFELEYDTKQLETFTVSAAPIEKRGDTISYLVSSFAGKEDRAIEDVLRNMPGIEVEPDGKILYQGLPLNKFYVEGLDLMEGRYSVVSKNLPHGSVSTVEILENHQPIRILEDRVTSQQAALNLKLKPGITTTGTARLGSGLSPFLYDINVTPMTFTKHFQVVTSYQANNTGNDVSQQLNVYTLEDFIRNINRPSENSDMLNIQSPSPPEIDQSRYLDNNIHLLNFNLLNSIGNDFQLRTNIFYVNDIQQQEASVQHTLYNPTDTVAFLENLNNRLHNNYLQAGFSLNRNVKKNYLNNELKIKSAWDEQSGMVFTNNENIEQSLEVPFRSISNDLRTVNSIGKHLVEFRSFISFNNNPHELEVNPGPFEGVLNNNEPYEAVSQQMNLERFFTDNSASLSLMWKRLVFTPRLGVAYRQQTLESNIIINQPDGEAGAGSNFENALDGRQTSVYLETDVEYRKGNLTIKAKLPLRWQNVYLDDLALNQGQELNRLLFNPGLSVNYQISAFWKVRSVWSYANSLGDIDRVHYGFIMRNYRNLSQNAVPLAETSRQNIALHLSYRNPITSFFNTLSYVYAISNPNLMYSSLVQSDGTSIQQAFPIPNANYAHALQFYTSKYISVAKTTIGFRANYNHLSGKSLMNTELFKTTNVFYVLSPDLNVRITSWLNSEYSLNATVINTFIENDRKSNISILKHKLNFFAFPWEDQLISLSTEYYNQNKNNNLFVDLLYRYTITKRKIDLELRWNNIFNNNTYTSYQSSAFTVWESTYLLRPSQVLFSVKFSF